MKLLLLLLFTCCMYTVFGQPADTIWWVNKSKVKIIINHKPNNVASIKMWNQNGTPMGAGIFKITNHGIYTPLSNVVMLDSMGHKMQEYILAKGKLTNYMADGKVLSVLIALPNDTAQRFYEYYTNGNIKTENFGHRQIGESDIRLIVPNSTNQVAYFYQQVEATWLYQTCYPNGKIYSQRLGYGYETVWFTNDGKIDTTACYAKRTDGWGSSKMGRRWEWWNNGNLKSEDNYKDDRTDGWQRTWYKNGVLHSESFYANGVSDNIARIWYDNGQLQYYHDRWRNRSGPTLSFYRNGNIARHECGLVSDYDSTGKLIYEAVSPSNFYRSWNFKNQPNNNTYIGIFNKMRQGKWTAHDAKGLPIYSVVYENGLLQGEALFYDTLGQLMIKAHYKQGRLHGEYLQMNINPKDTLVYQIVGQ